MYVSVLPVHLLRVLNLEYLSVRSFYVHEMIRNVTFFLSLALTQVSVFYYYAYVNIILFLIPSVDIFPRLSLKILSTTNIREKVVVPSTYCRSIKNSFSQQLPCTCKRPKRTNLDICARRRSTKRVFTNVL